MCPVCTQKKLNFHYCLSHMINKTKITHHTKCGIIPTKDTLKTHKTLDTCNSSLLSLLITYTNDLCNRCYPPHRGSLLTLLSPTPRISFKAFIPHMEDIFKGFYPPHRESLLTLLSPTPRISLKAFIPHTEDLF